MASLKESEGKYDDLFGAILQQEGKMEPFFDHVFNFLYRRTDFYITMKIPTDKMGFTPGRAEMIVRESFKKYETQAKARELRAQQPKKHSNKTINKVNPIQQQDNSTKSVKVENESIPSVNKNVISSGPPIPSQNIMSETDSGVETTKKKVQQSTAEDTYNGGVTDTYRWSQTLTELDVLVDLPVVSKAKDVTVIIQNTHLKVTVKKPEGEIVLIEGDLPHKVLTDSSLWMVEGGVVHVSLDKAKERMWGHVFEGEEEIDLTKVDAIKEVSDLDTESHAAINRVMFDQHQKMQGKPQSHELETYEMLEKAWDVEGSPFKGTPFDPSKVNLSNNNYSNCP
ncbi:NudC domain-containing protein 3-like [Oopsacas minuta]|uniref:NudC domain-containing protein 3-like n=1 Tax=Oopsacas minuta TaxID=111878 RepID=A0AAV7KGH3_9METZ|nr:NudC domain-containing protein 3-like [Oopsacas minuta]